MKGGGGPDQKNINAAANSKMGSNPHLGGGGIGNVNGGEGKRGNEINAMGLGFPHGHGGGGAGLGLGGSGLGFQALANNNFQGPSGFPAGGGFGGGFHHSSPMMMNMQGYQQYPSMLMNMPNRQTMMNDNRYIQPQMMYSRSPVSYPHTGYYQYKSYPSPLQSESANYASHMFSDENTSSCVIM